MPKKSKSRTQPVRVFKGAKSSSNNKSSPTHDASATSNSNQRKAQIFPYLSFLYNYIHFTKEQRNNKGEGLLEDNVLQFHALNQEEFYALLVQLAKDVNILSEQSKVDEEEFSQDRLDSLFQKIFTVFTATTSPALNAKQEKQNVKKMKNFVEMVSRDTVDKMVKFLVNYKFNQCDGINLCVLQMHELLFNLGRFEPKWNVQMVESGLISGWLIRILDHDPNESCEAIEIYRLFATQWINVIASEYHLFRRRAREKALTEKQKKIQEKRALIQEKNKQREEEQERKDRELEEKIRSNIEEEDDEHDSDSQDGDTHTGSNQKRRKKKRVYDDDHLFEDDSEEDDDAELEELERLEKEEHDGSDDPNVIRLRKELFDDAFVRVVVQWLNKIPQYDNENTFVVIALNPEDHPEHVSRDMHMEKCNKTFYQQLLRVLTELLMSTCTYDEPVFKTLVESMMSCNVDQSLERAFSNVKRPNTLRRAFNFLYYLLHSDDDNVQMQLFPVVSQVKDIFLQTLSSEGTVKDTNLAIACLYNLGYITSSSERVTTQLHEEDSTFFDALVTIFTDRKMDNNFIISLYACITSFVRFAVDSADLLELEQSHQFVDTVITDTKCEDSRLRFPGIVTIRVIVERLEQISASAAAPIYQKILDSGVTDVMLHTIFNKKFQQDNEKKATKKSPQFEASRVLHQRFLHPGSLCTLNVLLDQSSKTGNMDVNNSLGRLIGSDQRYAEIVQFMRYMQQSQTKRFSYKYVFILIGVFIFLVGLFSVLLTVFDKTD